MKLKWLGFAFAGLVLLAAGYLAGSAQQRLRPSAGFLQSTSAKIELGVWDKQDTDKTDRAVFIVTGPDGKQYKAERAESLDDWVYVSFPGDFSVYPEHGDIFLSYKWKCIVGGKTVANGVFKWGNGQADDNNRNIK